jgi:DNA-binding NtrC family response regulator
VKLLRVLETRTLHRIGDTRMRRFEGRISAATNRDIDTELEAGRLRLDFYYRLCADEITTPSLRDMIADDPDELRWLVRWHAVNLAGSDADEVTQTVMRAIETQVGWDYDWPGNMRELQQCIRNILIRGVYRPQRGARRSGTEWARQMADGGMTAGELMAEYCAEIVRRAGSYAAAGKLLQLDPRTVRTHALKAAEPAESVD